MSEILANFHFVRPFGLLFLLPALALWEIQSRASNASERWKGVIDPALLRHLLVGGETTARATPSAMLVVAWVLGAVAVAGPTWAREPSPFADARPPVVAVLKVTPSMQAADLAPTRLDRARQKLSDLIALREGAATGLVAYSGSSHLVVPPTADGTVVTTMAQALSPEIMPVEGDDLAAALALASETLAGGGRGGSILVVADGAASNQITRMAAADRVRVPITIWAMSAPDRDVDVGALQEAADALGATRVETTVDQSDVRSIARRLDRAAPPGDVAEAGERWNEAGYWLTPLLALLTAGWFRRGWALA